MVQIKRLCSVILSLILCLSLFPVGAIAIDSTNGAAEANWQTSAGGEWQSGTFAQAIAGVYDGGTVKLLTDVAISETITIPKSMTVTSETPDNPKQITRGDNANGYLFNIAADTTTDNSAVSVTLENIIVDGGSKANITAERALISVTGGELVLAGGAVIRNNNNTTDKGAGGGICIISGKVQMNSGVEVENCSANNGGGVALVESGASLVINGGTIHDCGATGSSGGGGAVYVQNNAAATMCSGELSDNQSVKDGGGVYVHSGTFTQNGGTIAQNNAPNGGGVYIDQNQAKYIMSDGSIQDNTANYGAGAFLNIGTIEISGGEIVENIASGPANSRGGAMLVAPDAKVLLSGVPVITGNIGTNNGKDDILLDWGPQNAAATIKLKNELQDGAIIGIMLYDNGEVGALADKVAVVGDDEYTVTADDLAKIEYTSYSYFLSINDEGKIIVQNAIPVSTISVTPESLSLTVGASSVITAIVTPSDATYPEISWHSSDTAVATVDANGMVAAVNPGTATITATASGGDNVTVRCVVTVTKPSSGGSGSSSTTRYTITVEDSAHGQVESNRTQAERGDTVTLTVTPDEGWELDKLTVSDSGGNEIAIRDRGNGKYTFAMPRSRTTVEAVFTEIMPESLPFVDVPAGAWYESAIRYVYENGLMTGTSTTTFSPDVVTTRAQIVTILWRMAGSPVVNYLMDFSDVSADAYYTEAVCWAASESIIGGYGNGKFGPNDPVIREQFAVILYRYKQKQGGGFTGAWALPLEYEDADQVSAWAYEPLCWMTMKGIIAGTSSTTLSPQGQATRAQTAAMLMRFLEITQE